MTSTITTITGAAFSCLASYTLTVNMTGHPVSRNSNFNIRSNELQNSQQLFTFVYVPGSWLSKNYRVHPEVLLLLLLMLLLLLWKASECITPPPGTITWGTNCTCPCSFFVSSSLTVMSDVYVPTQTLSCIASIKRYFLK